MRMKDDLFGMSTFVGEWGLEYENRVISKYWINYDKF